MENKEANRAHVLVVPYPVQGHINPMYQFCRRLVSKGVTASLAITNYLATTLNPKPDGHVRLVTISDGYDKGWDSEPKTVSTYIASLKDVGSRSIRDVIINHLGTTCPITCLVYDSTLPWALDVAKANGLFGGPFFTQASAVNYIYYLVKNKQLGLPVDSWPVRVTGLPELEVSDMPSFVVTSEAYPVYLEMVLNQFSYLEEVDFVLVNTYYELEDEVIDAMSSKDQSIITIGPTIPSMYLDNQISWDKDYGLNLYNLDSSPITTWLSTKPPKSIVYASFGSVANLSKEQVEELAWGLKGSGYDFLWVVRDSEEAKLLDNFGNETIEKGLIVKWCPQLEVLVSEAIGCFLTHCGWNSTLEALVLGVPLIAMPQWVDQPLNAKLIEDIWKVGVRAKPNDDGLVRREEIASCIEKVMLGKKKDEFQENCNRWKNLAKKAISQGGSSDRNINSFISKILN